ncbi:hypothetical protein TNIN_253291 [Trichonephila inaurata madagascariensis]|uniref:Uncharacterized protein n=1 Tax=Trichonephila inaurata madagascariensis TaxID=2747483 RepID=A0A8X6XS97_9ARAC|nr:hypothetical protein TNIN_253291 [Trichonephila inaurata madagascariensis]
MGPQTFCCEVKELLISSPNGCLMTRRRPYFVGMVCAIVMNSSRRSKVSLTAEEFSCTKMSMAGSVEVLVVVGVAWDDFLEELGLGCWRAVAFLARCS